jgi:hypothetical protein
MGKSRNIGQDNSLVVFGNPESFKKLIKNHGQLAKVKQALPCPCAADNGGSPNFLCPICKGNGFVYSYQRRFFVADEQTQSNKCVTELYPYYVPVIEVVKAERIVSDIQGGIVSMPVTGFDDNTIFIDNAEKCFKDYEKKRVSYFFDGWTKIEGDALRVDSASGYMWPTRTRFDAQYQSSNPLQAEADIAKVDRVYRKSTGEDIQYEITGNTFRTRDEISAGDVLADYYISDLTQIVTADIATKNNNEKWIIDLTAGEVRMALFPWHTVSRGDLIVLAACNLYRSESIVHRGDLDQLWELEVFEIGDFIIDSSGNRYDRGIDYVLDGRFVRWLTDNRPADEKTISVRYGYKPTYICFEDNPEPNNLENKTYPKIIFAKSWSKIKADDIAKINTGTAWAQ